MDRKELMDFFNSKPHLGTMATTDGQGNVNCAVFSALRMTDENTVAFACGANRTLSYLGKNPRAAYAIFEPAGNPMDWKGARLYLKVRELQKGGVLFDQMRESVRSMAGDMAAGMVNTVVVFDLEAVRPLLDAPTGV